MRRVTFLILFCSIVCFVSASAQSRETPNILIILADDPQETNNLYLKRPDIVHSLQKQLQQIVRSNSSME